MKLRRLRASESCFGGDAGCEYRHSPALLSGMMEDLSRMGAAGAGRGAPPAG